MNRIKLTLRALRINEGLSREELAEKLGVHKSTIHRWENGAVIPSDKLNKIAEVFEVGIEEIDTNNKGA